MTNLDFNAIVERQLARISDVLAAKGEEYSLSGDRLEAFKKAANLQGETVKQALCGMLAKHVVSVYDMAMSENQFSAERWDEKLTDVMCYLLLLKAAIEEENHG